MRYHNIEDAFGSEWRHENKYLDDKFQDAIIDLIMTANLEVYQSRAYPLLVVADCLNAEGRISDRAYWNWCEVNRAVVKSYHKTFTLRPCSLSVNGWLGGEWE